MMKLRELKKSIARALSINESVSPSEDDMQSSDDSDYSLISDTDRRNLYPRASILWENVSVDQVMRLLGSYIDEEDEEQAKEELKRQKIWPFYYPHPNDPNDNDRFPFEFPIAARDEPDQTSRRRSSAESEEKRVSLRQKLMSTLSRLKS